MSPAPRKVKINRTVPPQASGGVFNNSPRKELTMKHYSLALLALLAIPFAQAAAQDKKKDAVETPAPAPTQTLKPALEFGLQDGTPVRMRIARNLSSADAKIGETVDFEVLDDVKFGETVIIPRGGIAWATVTEAQPKRRMGRAGKLNVNIDNVRILTGEK